MPGNVFAYKINEEMCHLGEIFNEATIIISEFKEFTDTFDVVRNILEFDYVNLFLRHVNTLI